MSTSPIVHIALCSDAKYLSYSAAATASALLATTDSKVCVHLISADLSPEAIERYRGFVEQLGGLFVYHQLSAEQANAFHVTSDATRLSCAAYYRIFIPELVGEDIERILYIDGDIAVTQSLTQLYDIPLDGKAVAATEDLNKDADKRCARLGYPAAEHYFNSGVLVFNLKVWREDHLVERCVEHFRTRHHHIVYDDQDLLNAVLHGRVHWLPIAWNAQDLFYRTKCSKAFRKLSDEEIRQLKNPIIVHFCGPLKPWHWRCMHPFRREFFKALAKTPWADRSLRRKAAYSSRHYVRLALTYLRLTKKRYQNWNAQ